MIKFIPFTCLLYTLAFSVQAADYYVCSNGSDLNDGLSHATAWKTYTKAQDMFSSLMGGDSILFCKGEEFVISGSTRWTNYNSTSNNRITISSYTPPNAVGSIDNPTIYAAGGGSAFKIEDGGNADHDEGYVISSLILRGGNYEGSGVFIYNDADYIDIIDVEIYDFRIGIHLAGSNAANIGSDGRNSDVKIKRAYIHDNNGQGFLGGSDNLVIENSDFINNGFQAAILNHNIYISNSGGSVSNEIIRNNRLYQNAMFEGKCNGVSLVAHGVHTNLLIENNVIWEDVKAVGQGCWGIAIDNGHGGAYIEQFEDLTIRGNTIVNVGNMAIGCAVCQDVIIEDNTIVHQSSFGMRAISVPDRDENAYPALPQSNNITVRNNIVLYDSSGNGMGVNLGDGDASNYTSVGNQIYYDPGSGMIAGCESYNAGDVISVSAGICQNSIPQSLLNNALARTELPIGLRNLTSSEGAEGAEAETGTSAGGAGGFGWYFLGLLAMLLGIKIQLSKWAPGQCERDLGLVSYTE